MAISSKSKVRDILADPRACAICDKYCPDFSTERVKNLAPVMGMKFNMVMQFPQVPIPEEDRPKIIAELDALDK